MTKLYEIPRRSWFMIAANPDAGVFQLEHLDGMYSLCWFNGEPAHIAAYADVIIVDEPKDKK